MRVLAAIGSVCFAYLAVIPGAVVGATIDPACAGGSCQYSVPVTVYLVIAFGATALALASSALVLALYAIHPGPGNERLVASALKASAALTGVLLISQLAMPHPVAALVIVCVCVPVALIGAARRDETRARRRSAGTRRALG